MKRLLCVAAITPLLGGCWFVYILGSFLDSLSGQEGQHCVSESAVEGGQVKFADGRVGRVVKLEGQSSRCRDPHPIRAVIAFDQ